MLPPYPGYVTYILHQKRFLALKPIIKNGKITKFRKRKLLKIIVDRETKNSVPKITEFSFAKEAMDITSFE